jgi:hypothetical protein
MARKKKKSKITKENNISSFWVVNKFIYLLFIEIALFVFILINYFYPILLFHLFYLFFFVIFISGVVSIVAIAGIYRTGKSYVLNRLLGRSQGFEIGGSVQACTKGKKHKKQNKIIFLRSVNCPNKRTMTYPNKRTLKIAMK